MSLGLILLTTSAARVAQHALGADVEQLDDALLVGGDDREIGAGENRVLQGSRLEQRFLAPHFGGTVRMDGFVSKGGRVDDFWHG